MCDAAPQERLDAVGARDASRGATASALGSDDIRGA
jgi:hypothetical protein